MLRRGSTTFVEVICSHVGELYPFYSARVRSVDREFIWRRCSVHREDGAFTVVRLHSVADVVVQSASCCAAYTRRLDRRRRVSCGGADADAAAAAAAAAIDRLEVRTYQQRTTQMNYRADDILKDVSHGLLLLEREKNLHTLLLTFTLSHNPIPKLTL